jgi:hypothetical protein
MTDINFSYSLSGTLSQTTESETLWSCHGVQIIPGPASTVVLFNPKNDARLLVQPEVARALEHCFRFKSLDEHLNQLFDAMPPLREQPEDALQILELVRDAGIFESADEAWQRLTVNTKDASVSDGAVRLFILTCDRPENLQRLLTSLRDQVLPKQIEALFVVDDSRHSESSVSNACSIDSAQTGMNIPIHHIDMKARAALISYLKANLPESSHTSIDFLLARSYWQAAPTYGQARNLALLLSMNYRALVMDDDILPEALTPPLPKKNLTFDIPNAKEAVFYESTQNMEQHTVAANFSPLNAMLQSLGQPLSQLLSDKLIGASGLEGVDGRLTTSYGAASRVYLSQCGTWGDPGTVGHEWILFQPEASIKRLLENTSGLEKTLASRTTWVGYRGATIGLKGTLSQLTGLDHRTLLPPYLPAGRGEDLLFSIMLHRLHPESAVFNEGWAVPHYPSEDRSSRNQLSPVSVNASTTMLVDWLARAPRDEAGISPEMRLFTLADEIHRLSQMTEDAIEGIVKKEMLNKQAHLLALCMDHLNAFPRLDNLPGTTKWQAFVEESRDNLVRQIQSQEAHPVADALTHAKSDFETLRRRGLDFANAIKAWPEICETARAFELS